MQIDKSVLGGLLIVGLLSGQSESLASQEKWIRGVAPSDLCVTEGSVTEATDHRLAIDAPKMRAYLMKNTPQSIEAHFTYRGPSSKSVPLSSGELRRQFGFKLRAQDPCNLVYAMWRIEPESKLVVSVKSNPAQHTSSECGNRGYRNVKGSQTAALPVLSAGQSHTLRAEMIGSQVRVFADNKLVWNGDVGSEVESLHGPVGMRSDNARLTLELFVKPPEGGSSSPLVCHSGPDAAE